MNTTAEFDVFLSYNTLDHAAAERIGRALKERGLTVFLDRWELVAGRPWPAALEGHLGRCRSAAIVLGPSGMGPWQQREHYLALDRQARDTSFGVIPVILRNADPALGFLSLNTWVDLGGGVDDGQALDLLAAAIRGEPPAALLERTRQAAAQVCPYRGLEVFREEDAPFFFGREAFTAELCRALASQSLVAVVGRSGSGKSSVVRAGLVPALRQPDADQVWEIATLLPGTQPLHALAGALLPLLEPRMSETDRLVEINKQAAHLAAGDLHLHQVIDRILAKQPGTDRLLLVADQWEELYTLAQDAASKRQVVRFVDELLAATEAAPLTLVLTLRADFYADALLHRGLADRFRHAVVNLGPMDRAELERAVTLPAEKVGLSFDPGLVDHLLDDVGDEPGNLPLMEFALKALWEVRRGARLRYEVYRAMGGVKGAIAARAETLYAGLGAAEREAAERVFTKLVRPGEETGDTRRRADLNELDEKEKALVRTLAGKEARLLVTGRDAPGGRETVEVAHEALIREWGRLKGWVDQVRADLKDQLLMDDLARQWDGQGRPRLAGLASGRALRRFQRVGAASELAGRYLHASRVRQRLVRLAVALALAILAGGGASYYLQVARDLDFHSQLAWVALKVGYLYEPAMVRLDGGGFRMGCLSGDLECGIDKLPVREVAVRPFALGRYEVTFAEYAQFAFATGLDLPVDGGFGRGRRPVIKVSWEDAVAYAQWLSEQSGKRYRLPTEAEWEYAARAGTETRWSFGDEEGALGRYAWFLGNSEGKTHPVGEKEANPWGLHDMHGNVWEWVHDCWHQSYEGAPVDGSPWLAADGGDCGRRVVRGGSWYDDPENPRSAYRDGYNSAGVRNTALGFRLAQDL